ncbi:MAG: hypothetical protein Q9184_007001 [Pyrenodesmia sp. 2 TL-2023]
MHVSSRGALLGLLMAASIIWSSAMTIPDSHQKTQSRTTPSDTHLTEMAYQHSVPEVSVHKDHPQALAPRGFTNVPNLPPGWKAVYHTTTTIVPVTMSAQQLRSFYTKCALAATTLDDRWQWTIQVGQLALQFTSRNRRNQTVTKELILATVLMLNEFAKAGFTDLFFATLWHELHNMAVDIQLRVLARAVEGTKVI